MKPENIKLFAGFGTTIFLMGVAWSSMGGEIKGHEDRIISIEEDLEREISVLAETHEQVAVILAEQEHMKDDISEIKELVKETLREIRK